MVPAESCEDTEQTQIDLDEDTKDGRVIKWVVDEEFNKEQIKQNISEDPSQWY